MPRLIDRDQRRDELAQAVWRIVTRRGIGALSIREVAAEAGVSAGSLRHLFPTRDELVIAAAEQMLLGVRQRIGTLPRDISTLEFAHRALAQTLPLDDVRRTEFAVNLALVAEEPAVPALTDVRRRTYDELRELCRDLVIALRGGNDQGTEDAARRLHVLVDGLAFHLFQTGTGGDDDWSLHTLRGELEALTAL